MMLAGKYGLGVLSPGAIPEGGTTTAIKDFWAIAEEAAAENGRTMDRGQWRLGTVAHLADSKKEAIEQVRAKAGRLTRHYQEMTIGREPLDIPQDKIIDHYVDTGAWCVGTPDDMIALIERLLEASGGFGGFYVQDCEMANREQTMHSYELIATVRDAALPGVAGRPGGVPRVVGGQGTRDRRRPAARPQPREPRLSGT